MLKKQSSKLSPSMFIQNPGLSGNTVTVNLNTVRNNIRAIKHFQTPSSDDKHHQHFQRPLLMAVIKDNAYSTDMLQMAKAFAHDDTEQLVDGFMVAHFSEARVLRDSGVLSLPETKNKKLLAIFAEPSDYEDVVKMEVETCVDSSVQIEELAAVAKQVGKPARLHLHVNTGMNRLGCLPHEALPLAKKIAEKVEEGTVVFAGLKTHLSTADETDHDFCFNQEHKFHEVVSSVMQVAEETKSNSIIPEVIHSQNTAWSLRYQPWKTEEERFEKLNMKAWPRRMLRIGIGMYGYCALEVENTNKLLKSAVTIRSKIAAIHAPPPGSPISYARKFYAPSSSNTNTTPQNEFRIATIPQGYGEGVTKWPDHFVCIRGKRCPIVGKITMDFIMADVTALGKDGVQVGDSVLLFGKEEEVEENMGSEVEIHVASTGAGTSPHQFMARGGYRLTRVFIPLTEQ